MSLLDNVRQTIEGAASNALEVGQNLSVQAQAQLNIKKLQLEHAKKLHRLGIKTYAWHKAGTMSTAGTVPREIHDLCHALDDLNLQIEAEQRKVEAARLEAEARGAKSDDGTAATNAAAAAASTPTPSPHSPIPLPPVSADSSAAAPGGNDATS